MSLLLTKVVSGGQTGVDRAALDAAIYLGIPHGGWCPRGRRAEDGRIPEMYKLQEMPQRDYAVRTEQNVIDSDGTLILFRSKLSGGTELTRYLATKHRRPNLCIDLHQFSQDDDEGLLLERRKQEFLDWLTHENILVLNVAGPRESTSQGIARQAEQFLVLALDQPPDDFVN